MFRECLLMINPLKIEMRLNERHLKVTSIFYLALPLFIWVIAWLQVYVSVPMLLVLSYAIYKGVIKNNNNNNDSISIGISYLLLVLVACCIWMMISGIGGFGFQNYDYFKHNIIFKELYQNSWPVVVDESSGAKLVYYIGFYIIPALVGKLAGWFALNMFSVVWAGVGIVLSLLWVTVTARKASVFIVIGFVLFSGADYLGYISLGAPPLVYLEGNVFTGKAHIEWWTNDLVSYQSTTTQLFWVPQHALVAWIATASLISDIKNENYRHIGLWGGVSVIWSPFVAIGLLPFYVYCFVKNHNIKPWLSATHLIALPILALVYAAFFLSLEGVGSKTGWIWNLGKFSEEWYKYYLFFLFDVLILAAFVTRFQSNVSRDLFYISLATLLVIPMYRFGLFNDFVMRSSLPALFVLSIAFVTNARTILFSKQHKGSSTKKLLILVIFFSIITPLAEISRSISHIHRNGLLNVPDIQHVQSIADYKVEKYYLYRQYIGYEWPVIFRENIREILPKRYKLGTSKENGNFILEKGWSKPEEWGVWSQEKTVSLLIPCDETQFFALEDKFMLSMIARSFGKQYIKISGGEGVLWEGSIMGDNNSIIVSVPSVNCVDDVTRLTIKISNPLSPLELGQSSDTRKLGIGLEEFQITVHSK